MFLKSIHLLVSNIYLSILYFTLSILAFIISNKFEGLPFLIVILCYALLSLNFFITGSEIIKEDNNSKSIKECFWRFDKDIITNIIFVILFLGAIFFILQMPMVIITMTPLNEKITAMITGSQLISFAYIFIFILFDGLYKMFFLSSLANVVYFKGDTIESLKGGLRTTFKLKTLLLIVILLGAAGAYIPFGAESEKISYYFEEVTNILLKPVIFFMAFYYYKEHEKQPLTNDKLKEGDSL